MADGKYINGLIIKTQSTPYGNILKVSAKVETLIEEIRANANGEWINFDILKRKERSPKGLTHYAKVSSFKSEPKTDEPDESDEVLPW